MTTSIIKKRSGPLTMVCQVCGQSQVKIGGSPRDWMPLGNGFVCGKDACRMSVGAPKYVPPDETR